MGKVMKEEESLKKFRVRFLFFNLVYWLCSVGLVGNYFESKAAILIAMLIVFLVWIISFIIFAIIFANVKENYSKDMDIIEGKEEAKDALDEKAESPSNGQLVNTKNIPEDYIPEPEPGQPAFSFNLGGNDMGNEIGGSIVFFFLFFPLFLYFESRFFLYDTFKVFFVCSFLYSLLAFWRLRKAYFKKGWVKVFARPNNILEYSHVSEGGVTSGLITEGWTFTIDEKQYNIRQFSRNHYKNEQEIYWNPKTDKLIINHNGYKVLFFLYSLVAYFLFFTGLLFSNQLFLHPIFLHPIMVLLFAPVLPTGLIIFCEMYFNQLMRRAVSLKLSDALKSLVIIVMMIVLFLAAFSLLILILMFRDWFFSDTNLSFWIYLSSGFTEFFVNIQKLFVITQKILQQ